MTNFEGVIVGTLTEIPSTLKLGNHEVLNLTYNGKYHAPIFHCYNNGTPCHLQDVVGKNIILKWGKDKDSTKGTERTYFCIWHWTNICPNPKRNLRFISYKEKEVGVGASIHYFPINPLYKEAFFSRGGNHWETFIITEEGCISGHRITATKNNHNHYKIKK